jgi:hypothetical protein
VFNSRLIVLDARHGKRESSDQSSSVTGTVLPVDGGQAVWNKPPQMYRLGQLMEDQPAGG